MRWFEKPEVLDYIVNAYQGMDGRKRQFIWEEPNGDILIGNSRAFADHLSERFGLQLTDKAWMAVHDCLRMLGEIAQVHKPHGEPKGRRFHNQEPEFRILKKGDTK